VILTFDCVSDHNIIYYYILDLYNCLLYYNTMALNVSGYTKGRPKKTSQGANKSRIKTSSMNKSKKRSWKAYVGQGK